MAEKLPELLPCPFCGGGAICCGGNEHNGHHWVMCASCHACPNGAVPKLSDSITAWNRRASPSVGAPEWHLAHVDITPETARIKEGQVAPGPTIWVRREYWKAEIGTSTEIKFTEHELAKAHIPQPPKAIAPSVGGVRVPDEVGSGVRNENERYADGWNACREEVLRLNPAAEVVEVEKLADAVEAARTWMGARRPDERKEPEDAEQWDLLTKAAALLRRHAGSEEVERWQSAYNTAHDQAMSNGQKLFDCRRLLDEVRCNFTRDDDLPDGLLSRIDAALDNNEEEENVG